MPTKAKKKVTKKTTSKKKVAKKSPAKKAKPDGYVFGRPTKYRKEMCQDIISKCEAEELITLADICCYLKIHHETLIEWQKKHSDFSEAIKIAEVFRRRYMERQGLAGMNKGKSFNAVPWLFMTKNMFPKHYSDRKEIELSGSDDKPPIKTFSFSLSEEPDQVDERGGDEPSE